MDRLYLISRNSILLRLEDKLDNLVTSEIKDSLSSRKNTQITLLEDKMIEWFKYLLPN